MSRSFPCKKMRRTPWAFGPVKNGVSERVRTDQSRTNAILYEYSVIKIIRDRTETEVKSQVRRSALPPKGEESDTKLEDESIEQVSKNEDVSSVDTTRTTLGDGFFLDHEMLERDE